MDFEYLEHTADIKFRSYGETLEEAFINAGYALTNIMVDPASVRQRTRHSIQLEARRLESLLYDFLEELIVLFETEHLIIGAIPSLKLTQSESGGYELSGELVGDDFSGYELAGSVKSVTYNDMEVVNTAQGYQLTVVLDA